MVRDIVVIGGSAGSLPAMVKIVAAIPFDTPAALFMVMHISAREKSLLPSILNGRGPERACHAEEGQQIEPGRIYVAPPDRHLMIGMDHVHVVRGPKEGLQRPSINVLFRSAAETYGKRVIGVLLSGMLDDGAAGLWQIANHRGVTIVQDPADALYPSMPESAVRDVPVDYSVAAKEIGPLVNRLVAGEEAPEMRADVTGHNSPENFSGFTCPECRGPLYESSIRPAEFRCRIGHVFPLKTLMEEHTSVQERKLYEALLALEEGADLAEFTAARAGQNKEALRKEAEQLRHHATAIRKLIEERMTAAVE